MKETFYFSHDYNASSDIRMRSLVLRGGAAALGLYWYLIEHLYSCSEHRLKNDDELVNVLCADLNFSGDNELIDSPIQRGKVLRLISNMIEIGLLEECEGYLRSESVDRRLEERSQRKEAMKELGRRGGLSKAANTIGNSTKDSDSLPSASTPLASASGRSSLKGKEVKERKGKVAATARLSEELNTLRESVLTTDEIRQWYDSYGEMRRAKRSPFTMAAEQLTLEKLSKCNSPAIVVSALKTCVEKSWTGIEWGIKQALAEGLKIGGRTPTKSGTGAIAFLKRMDERSGV